MIILKKSVSWWLWTELYGAQEGAREVTSSRPLLDRKKKWKRRQSQQTAIPVSDGELVGPANGGRGWVDVTKRSYDMKGGWVSWQCPFSDLAWRKHFSSYTAFPNVIFFKLFYLQKYKKVWSHFSFFLSLLASYVQVCNLSPSCCIVGWFFLFF